MKPAFFKNEYLATISPLNRLLFVALWCLADREGRLEDRPLRIKAEAFPYDACDIDKMLNKLADFDDPFIIRYQVGGKAYIQVVKAMNHFNPHPNENKSQIPPVPSSTLLLKVKVLHPKADALVLNPLSLNPESPILNPAKTLAQAPKREISPLPLQAFEMIWAQYPRKKGRDAAERHFKAQVRTLQDWLDIQNALANFKAQLRKDATEEKFIPHGSTWFNGRWHDTVDYSQGQSGATRQISEYEMQVRKTHGLPIPGMEAQNAPDDSARALHDSPIPRRPGKTQGLRKAGFQGPAGALLNRIRTDQVHADTAEESDRGSDKPDGSIVV